MKRILREPIFHFIILGAILYATVSFIQKRKTKYDREILVDNDRVVLILKKYKMQTGELPSKQQLNAMIDDYIKEEIYYREAKKMGLDADDEIVKRRLAQKMEFLQSDLAQEENPSEEKLKSFYQNNPSLFSADATVNFSHIFFSADKTGDSIAQSRAIHVLRQLKDSPVQHAPGKGDHFALQYDFTDQSLLDIKQNFGDAPMADSLFEGPLRTWIGPVKSGYGWHLLYISKRDSSRLLPYASIRAAVKVKFADAEKMRLNENAFRNLSKNYIVNRAYLSNP